ncbi:MAG: hypothetical protein K2Y32_19510 [Candidatus Obscuribacterales bacterium]|jgi:hypothetical protein|nr:hypothetical protein [Candidatus Obscuribacterales bacterium]
MPTLKIKTLHCITTEDNMGNDECLLEVLGGGAQRSYSNNMNNGDTWELNDDVPFNNRVEVKLTDLDLGYWPDRHDNLGKHSINADPADNEKKTFKQDGAHYELTYSVVP